MNKRLLNPILIGSMILLTGVTTSGAGTRWSRVTPQGTGFSVEVPGEPEPSAEPGQYVYSSGLWYLSVTIQAVDPYTRKLVERGERKALVRCLETLRDTMVSAVDGTRRSSSAGDLDGYPSLRFSMENEQLEGTDLLVLTPERLYIVITVGPKGARDADGERFVRSFRLVKTEAGAAGISHASSASSTSPLVGKMASSILVVARLINEARLNPLIDTAIQNAPPAARLGDRWNPSNAAWHQARSSISGRIEAIADAYAKSGEIERALESELGELAPESQAAIASALNGPAGPAILRDLGKFQFALTIMDDDPNGPKPGDPGRDEKARALRAAFDQRVGPGPALGDGTHKADAEAFFSGSSGDVFLQLWDSVLSQAIHQLKGGIELMFVDDSEAIRNEIETVIARVK